MMKERPILFSDPMVRAIIEGRKTMTRRIVKLNRLDQAIRAGKQWDLGHSEIIKACPYGEPGDRLWVREAWAATRDGRVIYRADLVPDNAVVAWTWRPSIHLSKAISRLTLEVTAVRIERLQDIDDADAQWEGCEPDDDAIERDIIDFVPSFRRLWNSINTDHKSNWSANPLVWVVEFKKL